MLDDDVAFSGIDADQWRNLQALVLQSASARPRIIVIHDAGTLLKLAHSQHIAINRPIDRVKDPREAAEAVYRANPGKAEFVAVFERRAVERYFAQVQDGWRPDECVDRYERRVFDLLAACGDGIVTYPDPAAATLGLQWRTGASVQRLEAAVHQFVAPGTTVVFGVFDDGGLWTSLVLGFDADRRVVLVTTADPAAVSLQGETEPVAEELLAWVEETHGPCSLGLFTDLDDARTLLANWDKRAVLRALAAEGRLLADPCPASLTALLGK
jgi:hypothetical protein